MSRWRSAVLGAVLLLAGQAASPQGPMSSSPAAGAPAAPAQEGGEFDVEKLFASTCGWCHSDAGRVAGRGPKLMDTPLTDEEITYRIKNGKPGAMPAFGSSFTDEQIKAIIRYTRNLKPAGTPPG